MGGDEQARDHGVRHHPLHGRGGVALRLGQHHRQGEDQGIRYPEGTVCQDRAVDRRIRFGRGQEAVQVLQRLVRCAGLRITGIGTRSGDPQDPSRGRVPRGDREGQHEGHREEVEGMSLMEGFAGGAVPIIASSRLSATSQYAISKYNKFKARDYHELAKRIDYWFDSPEKLKEASENYQNWAKELTVEKSAIRMLEIWNNYLNNKE